MRFEFLSQNENTEQQSQLCGAVVVRNGKDRWDRRQRKISVRNSGEVIHGSVPGPLTDSLRNRCWKAERLLSPLSTLLSAEQVSLATDGMFSSFLANLASQMLTLAVFGSWLAF